MLLSQMLFRLPQARVVPAPESDLQALPDIEHHFICLLVFLVELGLHRILNGIMLGTKIPNS